MKNIFKLFIFILASVMALCIAFAVACTPSGEPAETPSDETSESSDGGEKDDTQNGDDSLNDNTQSGDNLNGDDQINDDTQNGNEVQSGHTAHKPDATAAVMSALENLIKEPANFKISLQTGDKTAEGIVYLDLHSDGIITDISLEKTELRAKFGEIGLWLTGGNLYAAYGDIKLTLTLDEIASLAEKLGMGGISLDASVLNGLFAGEFTIDGSAAQLKSSLVVSGAEVPLTIDFTAGERNTFSLFRVGTEITLSGREIGVCLERTEEAAPQAVENAEEFVPAGKAIEDLAEIFSSQYLLAEIGYTYGGLELSGNITLNTATLEVAGTVGITYGEFAATYGIIHKNNYIYLSDGGFKIKLSVGEALNVIKSLLPEGLPSLGQGLDAAELLKKALGLKFDEYLALSGENGAFKIVLKADELLKEFGVELAPGDIGVTVENGAMSATVAGVTVKLGKGARFKTDIAGYCDLTSVVCKIPEIVEAGAISFKGNANLGFDGSEITATLKNGVISWKEGLQAYFDLSLTAGGEHDLTLLITENKVAMAYGEAGVEVEYSELHLLEDALFNAYGEVRDLANKVAGDKNPLPELNDANQLFEYIKGLAATSAAAGEMAESFKNFDLISLLKKIELTSSTDGSVRIALGNFTAEIKDETDKEEHEKLLGISVEYGGEKIEVSADLHAEIFTGVFPQMPQLEQYLKVEDFAEIIDYVVAAINTMCEKNVTLSFTGEAAIGNYSNFEATLSYSSPDGFPLTLNYEKDNKSIILDTNTYINFDLVLKGAAGTDDLYLTIIITDSNYKDKEEDGDGILDFYVSISRFGTSENASDKKSEYKPLYFHATADEILTILSGALVAAGVDNSFIYDFFITKWITSLETEAQLEACGNAIIPLLGNLLGGDKADSQEPVEEVADGGEAALFAEIMAGKSSRNGFIKKLTYKDNIFEIEVDTGAPDGKFTLTLAKTQSDEGEAGLTLLGDVNFNYGNNKFNGNLSVGYAEVERKEMTVPEGNKMYDFAGADELLLSLAKSVTHPVGDEMISGEETKHNYVLNNYYYIDGTISANLNLKIFGIIDINAVSVKINLGIGVTVDEKGIPAINLQLSYEGVAVGSIVAINGKSTVNITIKDGMVYMCRKQTSYYDGSKSKACDEILYRAMPLDNFFGDILNQLSFILNFSDLISEQIAKNTDNGSSQTETATVKDYGTMVGEVLTNYTYQKFENGGASWTLNLNGSSFSKGIIRDFTLVLSSDESGLIKSIKIPACNITLVESTLATITIHPGKDESGVDCLFSLTWHNPGDDMDKNVDDQTVDVGDILADPQYGMGAMIEKLTQNGGWAEQTFIEGKVATVNYIIDASGLNQSDFYPQPVMVSTGVDGLTANTLLSELKYPETPDNEEYYYVWTKYNAGDILPSDFKIHAAQHKQVYKVTFYSSEYIEDWDKCDDERYSYTTYMEYGSHVLFKNEGEQWDEIYTVTGNMEITLPKRPAGSSRWAASFGNEGTVFNVLYNRDTVNYKSDIAFELDGKTSINHAVQFTDEQYNLVTPKAEGYIFVGWFQKAEDGWVKVDSFTKTSDGSLNVTVEALWVKDDCVTLKTSKDGWGLYNYKATAEKNNVTFVGKMVDELNLKFESVQYAFVFDKNETVSSYHNSGNSDKKEDLRGDNAYTYAHVKATFTYTDEAGNEYTFECEKHAAF